MYGLEFKEADNSLICASASFNINRRQGRDEQYNLYLNPQDSMLELKNYETKKFEVVCKGDMEKVRNEVVKRLQQPKGEDFGIVWDWSKFWIALTYFDEGRKTGYAEGQADESSI